MPRPQQVLIGEATYDVNLLIVDGCSRDYILGFNFWVTYDLTLRPLQTCLHIGMEPESYVGTRPYRPYQRLKLLYMGNDLKFWGEPSSQ